MRSALIAAFTLTACADKAYVGAPYLGGPVHLSVVTSVAAQPVGSTRTVVLRVMYARGDNSLVEIGNATADVPSSGGGSIDVPITASLDLAQCLDDVNRGAPLDVCALTLIVVLRADGQTLDSTRVGPVSTQPGATPAIAPIELRAVASITLNVDTATRTFPDSVRLIATAKDATGATLTRVITFTSSDPSVATMTASGWVQPSEIGQVSITARSGSVTATASQLRFSPRLRGAVALGSVVSCILDVIGVRYCWGQNAGGSYGNGTTTSSNTPVAVSSGPRFAQLSSGSGAMCGLTGSRATLCWGAGPATGQPASFVTSPNALAGSSPYAAITVGSQSACGLTVTSAAQCWGASTSGELGNGGLATSFAPVAVSGGLQFTTISTSPSNGGTCGLLVIGTAYCWGANDFGQLGDGTITDRLVPTPVATSQQFVSISAGNVHTCALTATGAAFCWGLNNGGRLGDGTTIDRLTPVPVTGGLQFIAVTAGGGHSCGLTASGATHCWGLNGNGELGIGTVDPGPHPSPTPVTLAPPFKAIFAGVGRVCGVAVDSRLYCWGLNSIGQIGDGTTVTRPLPTLVAGFILPQ